MNETVLRFAVVADRGAANVSLGISTVLIELGIAAVTRVGAAITATGTGT